MAINTKSRKRRFAVLGIGSAALSVVGLCMGGGVMVANAAEQPADVTSYSASADPATFYGSGDHCAADITTNVVVCAATRDALPAAVKDATGKTVNFGTSDDTSTFSPDSTDSTFVLGTIYSYPDYGGRSLDMLGGGTACTSGFTWNFPNLGTYGWDNDIDSFKSWGNCRTTLYEDNSYAGAAYGPYWNMTSIGIMQNQASSIIYKF